MNQRSKLNFNPMRSARRILPLLLAVAVLGGSMPDASARGKRNKPWQRNSATSETPKSERTGLFNRTKAKAPTANTASSKTKKRTPLFGRSRDAKPKPAASPKPQPVRVRATATPTKPKPTTTTTTTTKRERLLTRIFKPRKRAASPFGNVASARKKKLPSGPSAPNANQAAPKYNHALLAQAKSQGGKIVVNIAQQRAKLYVGGQVALDTPISTARAGKRTPRGSFGVGQRVRQGKISTIYKVEMPYWMRLGQTAYGMHAGYLPGYPASAGCIRMPYQAAQKLFDATGNGTRVSIVGG